MNFNYLKKTDSDLYNLISSEARRQKENINLIASENFVSGAVLEALGSVFTNKYAEGYSGARYYAGNEFVDKLEDLTKKRALNLLKFHLKIGMLMCNHIPARRRIWRFITL